MPALTLERVLGFTTGEIELTDEELREAQAVLRRMRSSIGPLATVAQVEAPGCAATAPIDLEQLDAELSTVIEWLKKLREVIRRQTEPLKAKQRVTNSVELLAALGYQSTQGAHRQDRDRFEGLCAREKVEPTNPDAQRFFDLLSAIPVSVLMVGVRARKVFSRLNLEKLLDLIFKTGDDLLDGQGAGVTTLNEVRARLAELGLRLTND